MLSSANVWLEIAFATLGASFVFVIVIEKVSETLWEALSVAVAITSMVPTSEFVGVPEKVCVAALKLSQEGRVAPLDREAV